LPVASGGGAVGYRAGCGRALLHSIARQAGAMYLLPSLQPPRICWLDSAAEVRGWLREVHDPQPSAPMMHLASFVPLPITAAHHCLHTRRQPLQGPPTPRTQTSPPEKPLNHHHHQRRRRTTRCRGGEGH